MVTDFVADPPVPVQLSVNVWVEVTAGVVSDPDTGFAPVQPSEAVQAVAFVEDQFSCVVWPERTLVESAFNVSTGPAVSATSALLETEPPAPVHVSVNVLAVVTEAMTSDPDAAFVPVHPFDAVHVVASVELHVNVIG